MKENIQKESKAEYARFLLSEDGFRILQAAGYGGKMKPNKTKVLMDLSDTAFETLKESIKGLRIHADFTDKEKAKIREIQMRKNIQGFQI